MEFVFVWLYPRSALYAFDMSNSAVGVNGLYETRHSELYDIVVFHKYFCFYPEYLGQYIHRKLPKKVAFFRQMFQRNLQSK